MKLTYNEIDALNECWASAEWASRHGDECINKNKKTLILANKALAKLYKLCRNKSTIIVLTRRK